MQREKFEKEIEDVKKRVADYKDNNTVKKVQNYRDDIVEIKDKL